VPAPTAVPSRGKTLTCQAKVGVAWGAPSQGVAWGSRSYGFPRAAAGHRACPGGVYEHFATLVSRLGLPPVRLHDLRHGAATMLLGAGQPPKVISEVLGHSTMALR
jgi:integrase